MYQKLLCIDKLKSTREKLQQERKKRSSEEPMEALKRKKKKKNPRNAHAWPDTRKAKRWRLGESSGENNSSAFLRLARGESLKKEVTNQ